VDETRRTAAQEELGRRHPYLTVYGPRAAVVGALAVGGLGLWWAGQVGVFVPVAAAAVLTVGGVIAWILR
jgi:hypothetical protein